MRVPPTYAEEQSPAHSHTGTRVVRGMRVPLAESRAPLLFPIDPGTNWELANPEWNRREDRVRVAAMSVRGVCSRLVPDARGQPDLDCPDSGNAGPNDTRSPISSFDASPRSQVASRAGEGIARVGIASECGRRASRAPRPATTRRPAPSRTAFEGYERRPPTLRALLAKLHRLAGVALSSAPTARFARSHA